jgi:cytochrome c-type biogenesis protein CcmH
MRAALFAVALMLLALPGTGTGTSGMSNAFAFSADDALDDAALEKRALRLHDELRCPVCQGQAISDSNAELARDLRRLVRERLDTGDTDEDIYDFLSDRYGDFILLRPRIKPTNYVLWFGPALVFAVGAGGLWMYVRRRHAHGADSAPAPLNEAERKQVKSLSRDDSL